MVPSVRHFESLTLWIQSSWFTWLCMKSHERTFAKVDQAVHDNIFEALIAGSLSYLHSWLPTALFYLHRGTSLMIGSCWHVSRGRAALGLSFREHKRRNGQICPFSLEDVFLLTVDPGHVISNHRDSSRVGSCQLSSLLGGFHRFHFGWSFDFNRLYSTARLAYPRPGPNHKIHDLKPYNFAPNHTIFRSNHTILFQTIQFSF